MVATVWRVAYHGNTGYEFNARGGRVPQDRDEFERQRRQHVGWERFPSPFVSVFTDKQHALNWGMRMGGSVVYEISTRGLQMTTGGDHEYLVHGSIPRHNVRRWGHLEMERAEQRASRMRNPQNPRRRYHSQRPKVYHDNNGTAYSSEDEAMEASDDNDLVEYMMNH